MAVDEVTIQYNVNRLFLQAAPGNGQEPSGPLVNVVQRLMSANLNRIGGEALTQGRQVNIEQARQEALEATSATLQQLAVAHATGNAQNPGGGPAVDPQLAQAFQTGLSVLPMGGLIGSAASSFGIGNIFTYVGQGVSTAFEWIRQSPDENGNKRSFGEIWERRGIERRLSGFQRALQVTDRNFIAELMAPVPEGVTHNKPAPRRTPDANALSGMIVPTQPQLPAINTGLADQPQLTS
jgi:hypothetical protein